ncbi:MAG: tetratricopeptide repeat protein [Gemmatimonadales bacterium]|nr:MAG: tetratricopeptide repeat protein [Gemmatimonadales bacterium]
MCRPRGKRSGPSGDLLGSRDSHTEQPPSIPLLYDGVFGRPERLGGWQTRVRRPRTSRASEYGRLRRTKRAQRSRTGHIPDSTTWSPQNLSRVLVTLCREKLRRTRAYSYPQTWPQFLLDIETSHFPSPPSNAILFRMTTPGYQRFFAELKRRRVFRVMAVYGAVAFVVLQVADIALPGLGLPEWTITMILALALLGFPFAIVLAWAFESTPEGIKRTEEAAPGELGAIIAAPASQRWPAGVLALVGMTALLAGVWYMGRQSAPTTSADLTSGPVVASIAVLPFVNMSDDAGNEYFSDGISEELLNLLAKIPELHVAARTSSFSYKNQDVKLADVARELNVAHVLEGSVRKSGNEVRITAQLIKADDGFHMWSETWDRTLDDIFAIQDEIAADVVAQLKVSLLGAAPTTDVTDPEAYALFLQARQLSRQDTAEGFERSNALFEHALEIEPEYAAAWTGLARNYTLQAGFLGVIPLDEGYRLAREAANRALAIDPEYAEAYAVLGRIASSYDHDLAAAARHIEQALELDPSNPDMLREASGLAGNLGRLDEAIALNEYVVAHDPVNASAHSFLGSRYRNAGRLDEAIASMRTGLSLSPASSWTHYGIGTTLLLKGKPEEALQEMQQEPSVEWRMIGVAMAYHALGRAEESDAALAELIDKYEQSWSYNIADVLAFRGETDRAFAWLDKAVQYKDPGLSGIPTDDLFANLHDDLRWLPFLESIGKSPEQLAAIEFEVRLPQ